MRIDILSDVHFDNYFYNKYEKMLIIYIKFTNIYLKL